MTNGKKALSTAPRKKRRAKMPLKLRVAAVSYLELEIVIDGKKN